MKKRTLALLLVLVAAVSSVGWGYYQVVLAHHGAEMSQSASRLLDSLTPEQRKLAQMEFGSPQRVAWHFIPKPQRKGLQLRDMTGEQRAEAHQLLKNALSQVGYRQTTQIMELENLLVELERNRAGAPIRDPLRYYFTIFGEPSSTSKWGLSFEGHHLSFNFVVNAGKVVSSTPQFMGVAPSIVKQDLAGFETGFQILQAEEELGFKLVNSLTAEQKKKAILSDKAPADVRGAGEAQPPKYAEEGLAQKELTAPQRNLLWSIIKLYAEKMPAEVAAERLEAIEAAGFEKIYFAWAGALEPGIGHYYRIQGPTFVLEMANSAPDAAGNPANHIHCLWRDLRGDFDVPLEKEPVAAK